MSGYANISAVPDQNILFNAASGATLLTNQRNQLLNQEAQQQIGSTEQEMVARGAGALLNISDPAQRAAMYPQIVAQLQRNGFAKNAPSTLPDEQTLRALSTLGTPSQTQAEWAANIAANRAYTGATGTPAAPAAPAAGGGGGTSSGTATIGQRQNNPGNLTFAGQPYAKPGEGNRFAAFPDMPTGVAANADQLALYQTQHGINTVRGAVTRWVSDPKADLTSYIGDIAKSLGVGPDDKIDLTDPNVQAKFIQAQFPHESAGGGYVLNPDDVQKGVQMAAARRGQIVQPRTQVAAAPGAPAGGGGTPAPYRVAGAMQPPPGGTTTAPAAAPSQTATAPLNQAMPGGANGPPAAPAQAAPAGGPAQAPPPAAAPAGGPAPPQLQPLNAKGLTALQQQQIDAAASTGRLSLQDRIKTEQALAQQNIATQQKAFGDWIQLQQLQTSQGQLSVSQANSALEYWKAAHPDAKVTLSGGEIITQDPRNGQEIAPRIKVTPNEAPRFVEGQAIPDGHGGWRQPRPGEQGGTPGRWGVGAGGTQFFPAATRPPQGSYEQQQSDYREDRKLLPEIAAQGQNAQTAQIRLQTMLDLLPKITTGSGGYTRTQLANLAETAGFPGIARSLIAHTSDGDAAAAQEFGKLTLAAAGAAERGDLGSRGSLGALKLYQQNNPSLDLRPGANKAMLGMQLIAAQADTDYSQAALAWAKEHGLNFRNGAGDYRPLTEFDLQWQQQRNPQVYSAAMGALNGQPPEVWAKGLSRNGPNSEYDRALDIVSRASPNATVNTFEGRKVMQPNAAAPPPPSGYRIVR